MSSTLHTSLYKTFGFAAAAAFALLGLSLLMPAPASAATVSLTSVTTSSNNASTTLAKVGDTVSYQLTLTGGTPSATSTPTINIFNMGSTSMSGSGTSWSYSTTTSSAWTSGPVTFYIGWGGSAGESTTTVSQTNLTGANIRFDKTAPTVSSITSNATAAGVLKVGDTIVFTLIPGAQEYGGTVAGSYNGRALTWTSTSSGASFVATSTVTEGDTDRASALQISGVILSDAAGNPSSATAGVDIAKTIDANSPGAPVASPDTGAYTSAQSVTLTSSGSNSIRYNFGLGTQASPTCSSGTVYTGPITVGTDDTQTIVAIGCDTAGNVSSVVSFAYILEHEHRSNGGSGGGGSGSSSHTTTSSTVTSSAGTPVSGLSETQVQSILSLLASFGADAAIVKNVDASLHGQATAGGAAATSMYTRDLDVGASGADVKALQVFLNTHGFVIASAGAGSPGQETMTFGALTKAALAKFQAAHGISPAAGYFGPKTRALVAGM